MSQELTTILAAEIVESDSLPADDRDGTSEVEVLSDYGGSLADCVGRHRGRALKKSAQSEFLAGFSNAFDAVSCAVEIQRANAGRSETLNATRRPHLRIGVNHESLPNGGEERTCNEDNDVARLVALAEPGGICISRNVYDEVRFRIKLSYGTERDRTHTAYT